MARPVPRTPPVPWRRALRRARRSVALRWVLVAVAAAGAALETARFGDEAAARRDAWGTADAVAVAVRGLEVGDVVGTGDARVERRPRAVVPDGALGEVPVGRTVTAPVLAGEALVDARLAPGGLRGTAALVPSGWRAVAVPTSTSGLGAPTPPLAVGDRVDVLGPDLVAADVVVVDVGDDAVTVAVPADEATDVAGAVAAASVTLALRGAG